MEKTRIGEDDDVEVKDDDNAIWGVGEADVNFFSSSSTSSSHGHGSSSSHSPPPPARTSNFNYYDYNYNNIITSSSSSSTTTTEQPHNNNRRHYYYSQSQSHSQTATAASVDELLFGSQPQFQPLPVSDQQSVNSSKLVSILDDDDHPIPADSTIYPPHNSTTNLTPLKIFDRFSHDSSSDDDGGGDDDKHHHNYDDDALSTSSSSSSSSSSSLVVQNASKRLDNMIQFLDRKLLLPPCSSSSDNNITTKGEKDKVEYDDNDDDGQSLPEFVAASSGMFRAPVRAAMHPGRPPSLELRPHPLRETQIGCFLRTITTTTTIGEAGGEDFSTQTQLWAGSESCLRFWNLSQIYGGPCTHPHPVVDDDAEAVPFHESVQTPPTMCLIADAGNGVVWSGHRDGRIRCWNMNITIKTMTMKTHSNATTTPHPFRELFSWQAHRGPVFSIVIASSGDLWSGSEGGAIKIWPWESILKALSLTAEEKHAATLTVERSYIDLRSQVNNSAFCSSFTSDVKYLLSDHSGSKVWSAGYIMFALWDSRTRELLKVFNIDGQNENLFLAQDAFMEEEVNIKFVSVSRKERQQNASNFFQRSRNALMGAADAVRRVAVKGAFGDDNRRTEALITTVDGLIWTGCANGLIVQWDGNGNRLQGFQYHPLAVQCMMTFGSRIWVGYASGRVHVLDLNGSLLGEWVAHNGPIIDMSVGGGYVFTLANHGGIRGWNVASPSPLDSKLRAELAGKEFLYTRVEKLKILAGTWNVGQGRASHDSLISWLGSAAANVTIVVVGLQEVEMGAGFLAMSAAKETVGLEGSSAGQWWLDMIGKTLDEGSTFERVGSRQLAGLVIAVWVRNNIRGHVGDIDVAAVPCGFGRAIGNKGAVGLRMRVYGRIMCFVNCHFAAHLEAVNRRNADFDHVYRTMIFSRPTSFSNATAGMVPFLNLCCLFAGSMYVLYQLLYCSRLPLILLIAAGVSSAIQLLRGANAVGLNSVEGMPELSEADMVVFLGDFNYRLSDTSYDEARDFISQRCFDWLRERDQLQAEMRAGNVFQGMREAIVGFPPTYKFERNQAGLAGYDSGEKRRIPAWCDRILYRDNRSTSVSSCSLDCPVVSSIKRYEACMDVTDSDHKPVRCIFSVEIARIDELIRRQEFGEIMRSNEDIRKILQELCKVPETIVSTNNVILQDQDNSIVRITNKSGRHDALFEVNCEGQSRINKDGQASNHHPRGSFGFPRWLEVSPASGIIKPNHIMEISVHHEKYHTVEEFVDGVPQNWWCEDARDKEVILVVKVHGSCSIETRFHRIRVRHSLSSKIMHKESKDNSDLIQQANVLRRSDFQRLSCSSDVVDHLRNLHSP